MNKLGISRRSWHYRFLKHVFQYENDMPKSLCTYFWTLVFMILLVIAGGVLAIATFPVWGIGLGLFWLIRKFVRWNKHRRYEKWAKEEPKPPKPPKPPKEPSITWQYVKAKKRKVCPFVEYK